MSRAMRRSPRSGGAERSTLALAVATVAPRDLVSASAAARAVGVTAETIRYWIAQGRVQERGRGRRSARLVSLSEVVDASEWRAQAVSQREAAQLLHMETRRIVRLCEAGVLPYRRFGTGARTYEIDRDAVLRLAARRRAQHAQFLTLDHAVRVTQWPRWVLLDLVGSGLLAITPGERGAKLVKRLDLEDLVEQLEATPQCCPVCAEPVAPGRRFHKGRCAGTAVAAWLHHTPRGEEVIRLSGARQRSAYEQVKTDEGLLDIRDLARLLDRSPRAIWRHAERLGRGRRYPSPHGGIGALLFDKSDVARLRSAVEENAYTRWLQDPKRRAAWYYAKHKSTVGYGRLASAIAKKRGVPVGRPSEKLTDEKRERIHKLAAQGRSQRTIGRIVGLSRGSVEHVLRSGLEPPSEVA